MALIIQFLCLLLHVMYRVSVTVAKSEKGVGSVIKKVSAIVSAYSTTNNKRIALLPLGKSSRSYPLGPQDMFIYYHILAE
jgi:hypothetical protein